MSRRGRRPSSSIVGVRWAACGALKTLNGAAACGALKTVTYGADSGVLKTFARRPAARANPSRGSLRRAQISAGRLAACASHSRDGLGGAHKSFAGRPAVPVRSRPASGRPAARTNPSRSAQILRGAASGARKSFAERPAARANPSRGGLRRAQILRGTACGARKPFAGRPAACSNRSRGGLRRAQESFAGWPQRRA